MRAGSRVQRKHSLKHVNIIRHPEQPYEEQKTSVMSQFRFFLKGIQASAAKIVECPGILLSNVIFILLFLRV